MATTSRNASGSPKKKPATKAAKQKAAAGKAASGGTRTSSRSAKRRSPKTPTTDPAALEYERTEFLRAMDKYKRKTGKTFPSWTEVLEVLRTIGWMHPLKVQEFMDKQLAKSARAPKLPKATKTTRLG